MASIARRTKAVLACTAMPPGRKRCQSLWWLGSKMVSSTSNTFKVQPIGEHISTLLGGLFPSVVRHHNVHDDVEARVLQLN